MEEIRKILLEEKEKIGQEFKSRQINQFNVERDVGDEVDNSVVEQERELNLLLQDREKQHLEAIEEALQRIETGEYGFCDECGDQIDQKDLWLCLLPNFASPVSRMKNVLEISVLFPGFPSNLPQCVMIEWIKTRLSSTQGIGERYNLTN